MSKDDAIDIPAGVIGHKRHSVACLGCHGTGEWWDPVFEMFSTCFTEKLPNEATTTSKEPQT